MWSPVEMAIICGRPHRVAPTAEPLSDIVGNAFMHSAKKSHNGTDKSVPYGHKSTINRRERSVTVPQNAPTNHNLSPTKGLTNHYGAFTDKIFS
jgi:hypothetical protein